MKATLEAANLKKLFHQHGYRYTQQRQTVADFLWRHRDKHMTTDEAYALLLKSEPGIGRVTIHRMFHLLMELGLARRVEIGDGLFRYEVCSRNSEAHTHHHLICSECGLVQDMQEDMLDGLELQVEEKYGFTVEDHRVQFLGLCKNCTNRKIQN